MPKLIPLRDIPYTARRAESAARKAAGSRAQALESARGRIVVAPGCHSRPYFDPPVVGWTMTRRAGLAVASQLTRMPDGNHHRRTRMEWSE
jgi:hypothetical protein